MTKTVEAEIIGRLPPKKETVFTKFKKKTAKIFGKVWSAMKAFKEYISIRAKNMLSMIFGSIVGVNLWVILMTFVWIQVAVLLTSAIGIHILLSLMLILPLFIALELLLMRWASS